jgi:glycosyltransferase involved in cell wall biosynthesis
LNFDILHVFQLVRATGQANESKYRGTLMQPGKKILYVINGAAFFNTRLSNLARAAQGLGFKVHVATPESDDTALIAKMGFNFHPVPFTRSGVGLFSETRTLLRLAALYNRLKPDLVHHLTLKPVLYGGLAARWAGVPAVVSTFTGLGYVFSSNRLQARLLQQCLPPLLRPALNLPNTRVVFQNPEDRRLFLKKGLTKADRTALIHGTGVDTSEFVSLPEPEGRPLILFASRMLVEKGAAEFVRLAEELLAGGTQARFVMVGDTDPGNPSSIPRSRLRAWAARGGVEWWGRRTDIPAVLSQANLVCLPSYYGEGVPRILVEAAATARAVVTFDAPGCREIVSHQESGILVPLGDMGGFSEAVRTLLQDPGTRMEMGRKGRQLVEQRFTQQRIIDQNLALYQELSPCS